MKTVVENHIRHYRRDRVTNRTTELEVTSVPETQKKQIPQFNHILYAGTQDLDLVTPSPLGKYNTTTFGEYKIRTVITDKV